MKEKELLIMLLVLVISLVDNRVNSQQSDNQIVNNQLVLFTDRTLYITGEEIQFSVMPVRNNFLPENADSRILYVELITAGGHRITGGKYAIENGRGMGCLSVPRDVLSGEYYVRAYTRYMRNFGPAGYPGVRVKLINSSNNNILTGNSSTPVVSREDSIRKQPVLEIEIAMTDRKEYKTREKVDLFIETGKMKELYSTGWCITVVPVNSIDPEEGILTSGAGSFAINHDSTGMHYYPETRGVSISGKVTDRGTGSSAPGAVVTLSVIGEKDFSAYKTGQSGEFYFSLPGYKGRRDIFLSSWAISGSPPGILIDNDFCTSPVKLPSSGFKLTEEEKRTGLTMAVNFQVASFFHNIPKPKTDSGYSVVESFYGKPTETLLFDKYIQLPTLEEYFNELPMEVKIREKQGKKYFKFLSPLAEMMVYDPLVLVDWVVVTETDKLLDLSPQKISRIEIVNKPYVKGNLTYGGIISIISREGDFAGIDLPASGVFINYGFLEYDRVEGRNDQVAAHIPDSRNTLYWEPDVALDSPDTANISFITADTPGDYLVVLRGVGRQGVIYGQSIAIKVE
ncbi:MAG TPA: hypothetical protein VJ203_12625 [Bacteroidales bacterium]|nr:hypothetical protein [Bacteroidales bacterium]